MKSLLIKITKDNLAKLRERFPEIKTVTGNSNITVHEKCRKQARTDFYYLVLPNTEVYDTFNFDYSFAFGLDKEKTKSSSLAKRESSNW